MKGGISIKHVKIFTDGACSGNPGPGGWGAVLLADSDRREISGGEEHTTNNRMELMGVISALSALKEPCAVTLTTDSKYVVDSITKGWVYGWQKRGWVKSDKKPALNVDLWEALLPLLAKHSVTFVWVKGHAGHPENERCDELAVMESKRFCKQEKRVVASYYVVSVFSVERSGDDSAALDYSNIYYDKDKALEEAHTLSSRKGVIQVIAKRWNLYSDGTEEPCEHLFSWSENMKG